MLSSVHKEQMGMDMASSTHMQQSTLTYPNARVGAQGGGSAVHLMQLKLVVSFWRLAKAGAAITGASKSFTLGHE